MYTAAVLRPESVMELTKAMREKLNLESYGFRLKTPQNEPLPHHMTMNLGSFDEALNLAVLLNQPAVLTIESLWWSEKSGVCAARVTDAICCGETVRTINLYPHITICLRPPAKPVHSNLMLDDTSSIQVVLNEPLKLQADIREVP